MSRFPYRSRELPNREVHGRSYDLRDSPWSWTPRDVYFFLWTCYNVLKTQNNCVYVKGENNSVKKIEFLIVLILVLILTFPRDDPISLFITPKSMSMLVVFPPSTICFLFDIYLSLLVVINQSKIFIDKCGCYWEKTFQLFFFLFAHTTQLICKCLPQTQKYQRVFSSIILISGVSICLFVFLVIN